MGSELQELADDILANGQREPIVITPDGKTIVDGRNRLKAALMVGVEPRFKRLPRGTTEEEILKYIVSLNIKRRNLTIGQRAMLAQAFLTELSKITKEAQRESGRVHGRGQPKDAGQKVVHSWPQSISDQDQERVRNSREGKARSMAGKLVGVSGNSVQRAMYVANRAPDLAKQVRSGDLTVNAAYEATRERLGLTKLHFVDNPERGMLPPIGIPPKGMDKTRVAADARIRWIAHMAADAANSFQIAEKLDISDDRVRMLARKHSIEIPADKFFLKRKKGNFDINRVAEVVASDLEIMADSVDRIRDNIDDLDMSRVDAWVTIYRGMGKKLRNLSDAITTTKKELTPSTEDEEE